jgi:hypothetical protein
MRLVLSTNRLNERAGSETYLLTIATSLERLGHEVWLHSIDDAEESTLAAEHGLRFAPAGRGLPDAVDALVVQDGVVAYTLADRYPGVPQLFVAHSAVHDLQLPPQVPDTVSTVVALNERVAGRVRGLASAPRQLVRLRQPVALDLFRPAGALPAVPRRLLALTNRLTPARRAALRDACAHHGIEYVEAGGGQDPVAAIAAADIVVGYGRCVVEAMAAGRAVYVYDYLGGDGWVTADSYPMLEADGFGGRATSEVVDGARLRADLGRYDAEMGLVCRDLAVANHDADRHAAELAGALAGLAPGAPPPDVALELARLVRIAWHFELRAIGASRTAAALEQELVGVRTEVEAQRRRGDIEEARALAAEESAREAAARVTAAETAHLEAVDEILAFKSSRRYRFVERLTRVTDRVGGH